MIGFIAALIYLYTTFALPSPLSLIYQLNIVLSCSVIIEEITQILIDSSIGRDTLLFRNCHSSRQILSREILQAYIAVHQVAVFGLAPSR